MTRLFSLCFVVAMALLGEPLVAQGEDEYTIRLKPAVPHDERVAWATTVETKAKLVDAAGKVLKDSTKRTGESLVYAQVLLPDADGKGKRLRRRYDKAETSNGDKATPLAAQNKTVVVQLGAGRSLVKLDGEGELPADEVRFLEEHLAAEAAEDTLFYLGPQLPRKPVRLGAAWPLDLEYMAKQLGPDMPIDLTASRGTGKLLRVYELAGARFGVLEFHLVLAVKVSSQGAFGSGSWLSGGGVMGASFR